MPYLQVELTALEDMARAGTMAAVPTGDICWGLLRLWHLCWRKKEAVVDRQVLSGLFPGELDRLVPALACCEFITVLADGRLRVRGADRRLGILKAQSEAGKRNAANLKQFRTGAGVQAPGRAGGDPEVKPAADTGSTPALTFSIQHSAFSIQKGEEAPPVPLADASDLEQQVGATFQALRGRPYRWGRGDLRALGQLLTEGERPDEVLRRWGLGLQRTRFPTVNSVAHLAEHWNACVAEQSQKPKDVRRGHIRAEDMQHSEEVGDVEF